VIRMMDSSGDVLETVPMLVDKPPSSILFCNEDLGTKIAFEKNKMFDYQMLLVIKQVVLVFVLMSVLVACMMWCRICLFGVFVVSACMVSSIPVLYIPLFSSLCLLIILYWHSVRKILDILEYANQVETTNS